VEGFAYRLVPIKGQSQPDRLMFGNVASDLMYDNLMNKFKWGGMNDPNVYLDENNMRMMTNVRNSFSRLAGELIKENKPDSAIKVIDRCFELVPTDIVEPEYFAIDLADNYFKAGASEKGIQFLNQAFETYDNELNYFFSLNRKFVQTKSVNEEIQRTIFYLQILERTARNNGQNDFAQKVGETMQAYFAKFSTI
jgi:tetratricopeptide (TPR) repeat protein